MISESKIFVGTVSCGNFLPKYIPNEKNSGF